MFRGDIYGEFPIY